jgi:AcrR family transcriptional regulator
MSDLRTRQREATQELILETAQQMVVETHGWTMSMDQVAERAGVSRRTLYRYFATKTDLLDAASRQWADPRLDEDRPGPRLDELEHYLSRQWNELHENLPALLAQRQSASGREIRARWVPRARNMAERELSRVLDAGREDIEGVSELSDLMITLMSSSTFLELVDRLGRTPEDAARIAAWGAEAIVERARRDGGMVR